MIRPVSDLSYGPLIEQFIYCFIIARISLAA